MSAGQASNPWTDMGIASQERLALTNYLADMYFENGLERQKDSCIEA
jgi:hypothetical protein